MSCHCSSMRPWRVALLAAAVRLGHLLLLVALDQALPDYDSSARLHPLQDSPANTTFSRSDTQGLTAARHSSTTWPWSILEDLMVWDSVFFTRIARAGYEYEQYYAFFPLLPYLASRLGPTWVAPLALLVSWACSTLSAVFFAALSQQVLQQPRLAASATLLLLLGQACTFHTVAYTEALFTALTMLGLYCLYCHRKPYQDQGQAVTVHGNVLQQQLGAPPQCHAPEAGRQPSAQRQQQGQQGKQQEQLLDHTSHKRQQRVCQQQRSHQGITARDFLLRLSGACAAFCLASCTRSNGFINAGYVAHSTLGASIDSWQHGSYAAAAGQLAAGAAGAVVVAAPLAAFQLHGYVTFCCPHRQKFDGRSREGTEQGGRQGQGTGQGQGARHMVGQAADLGLMRGVVQPLVAMLRGMSACSAVAGNAQGWEEPGDAPGAVNAACAGGEAGRASGIATLQCSVNASQAASSAAAAAADKGTEGTSEAEGSAPECPALASCPIVSASEWPASDAGLHPQLLQQPLQPRPWCRARLPNVYAFVQQHYWGVGLLRYWRLQQLPNFLLAAPALLLAAAGTWSYVTHNPALILCGGWPALLHLMTSKHPRGSKQASASADSRRSGFLSSAVAVHIYPWAFMALCALLAMHVQVATRFLSCCPAQYWYMAHLMAGGCELKGAVQGGESSRTRDRPRAGGRLWRLLVWGCCLGYTAVGSVMLPNFYPWT